MSTSMLALAHAMPYIEAALWVIAACILGVVGWLALIAWMAQRADDRRARDAWSDE